MVAKSNRMMFCFFKIGTLQVSNTRKDFVQVTVINLKERTKKSRQTSLTVGLIKLINKQGDVTINLN